MENIVEEEQLVDDQLFDVNVIKLHQECIKIARPADTNLPHIPFCIMFPIMQARDHSDARYNISCSFRSIPGSASMRIRLLGQLMSLKGIGEEKEELVWLRYKNEPSINDDSSVQEFNKSITEEMTDALEDRYKQLEDAVQILQTNISQYLIKDSILKYNFAFYERWEQYNGVNREIVFLSDGISFMHDKYSPMYKTIIYVAKYGITQKGKAEMENDLIDNEISIADKGFEMYERLLIGQDNESNAPIH
jgi:hypothetical protein